MNFADQASVVLLAQLRMFRNMMGRRGSIASIFSLLTTGAWYALFAAGAVFLSSYIASSDLQEGLLRYQLNLVLLGILVYWQLSPIVTVSFGLALDLKRLLIFPIRPGQFFLLELLLCLPTSVEPILLFLGVATGVLRNPGATAWPILLAGAGFLTLNLCLSVALRSIVNRVSKARWWREGLVLLFTMIAIVPQWFLLSDSREEWLSTLSPLVGHSSAPWSMTVNLLVGQQVFLSFLGLAAYTFVVFLVARALFFQFLSAETMPVTGSSGYRGLWTRRRGYADLRALGAEVLGRLFPEPISTLVQKEFLTFTRSPRFLTVFIMGFTFGIVVFLPIAMEGSSQTSFMSRNFLTVVTAYAVLLMSETVFWNIFGLDRKAIQTFLFIPIRLQQVFIAKNIVAFVIVCSQVVFISLVCAAIGVPVTIAGLAEAMVAAVVLTINMFAIGNQSSVRYPAGVNPDQSWATANKAKFRLVLMLLFPLVSLPTTLAYVARFAFDSDAGFYLGMGVALLIAVTFYLVSLDSAIDYARAHREDLVDLLGTTDSAT